MHWLSSRNRSEFLAVPDLVRFTRANGAEGPEATLLIKAPTLLLKYLLRLRHFRLLLLRIGPDWLAYGIEVSDDPDNPAIIWSLLEFEDEHDGLSMLTKNPKCVVFLFNEAVVNVAWTDLDIDLSSVNSRDLIENSNLHPENEKGAVAEFRQKMNMIRQGLFIIDAVFVSLPFISIWHTIKSTYITNRITDSQILLSDPNEGGQQEEIALWLTDNLQSKGTVKSPQIHQPNQSRELSDLLLSHDYGPFLIESKTLGLLDQEILPNRTKLTNILLKHLDKATRQLIGGVKNVRRGYRITDKQGNEVDVERSMPPHVIILVPDLSLLSKAEEYGGDFIRTVSQNVEGFFHILDPTEPLRMVQAAEMIAARNVAITPLMGFDSYLMRRIEIALNKPTPHFGMLIRFSDELGLIGL